jgi:hypothetical protein
MAITDPHPAPRINMLISPEKPLAATAAPFGRYHGR